MGGMGVAAGGGEDAEMRKLIEKRVGGIEESRMWHRGDGLTFKRVVGGLIVVERLSDEARATEFAFALSPPEWVEVVQAMDEVEPESPAERTERLIRERTRGSRGDWATWEHPNMRCRRCGKLQRGWELPPLRCRCDDEGGQTFRPSAERAKAWRREQALAREPALWETA